MRTGSERGCKVSEDVIRLYITTVKGLRDWKLAVSLPPRTVDRPGPEHNRTVHGARHMINQVTVQSAHNLAEKMVRGFVCYSNGSLTQIKAVCQFFLRGSCKFGNQCRNEHPQNGDRRSTFGGKSSVVLHCLHLSVNL